MAASASAERDAAGDDAAARAVRELAADLLPSTREISGRLVDHLAATLPELAADDDEELRQELLTSADANIDQVLRLLRAGARGGRGRGADRGRPVRPQPRTPRGHVAGAAALLSPGARVVLGPLVAGAARAHRRRRRAPRGPRAELDVHVRLRRSDLRQPRGGVRDRARAAGARRCSAAPRDRPRGSRRRAHRRGARRPQARLRAAPPPRGSARVEQRERGARPGAGGARGGGRTGTG